MIGYSFVFRSENFEADECGVGERKGDSRIVYLAGDVGEREGLAFLHWIE